MGELTIFGVNIPAGFAFITGSIGAGFRGARWYCWAHPQTGRRGGAVSTSADWADGKYLQYIPHGWLAVQRLLLTYIVGKVQVLR
ncbi:hypothetical protein MJ559_01715 [Klebsiella pneumoniae]|nr:hypothetical protein MJ559_01715 [Klebsiella pneumoniae]